MRSVALVENTGTPVTASVLTGYDIDITTEDGFNKWVERLEKRQRLSHAAAVAACRSMLQRRLNAGLISPNQLNN